MVQEIKDFLTAAGEWAMKIGPPAAAGVLGAGTELALQKIGGKKITFWGAMGSLFIGGVSAVYAFKLFFGVMGWTDSMAAVMCFLTGTFFKVVALWVITNHDKLLKDLWATFKSWFKRK